jgi:DNA repair protein RadD
MLRPYQQAAFDAAITYIRKCYEPCLIEAATGAGKSHIIASIAEWVHSHSGKKVLCLAPSKELIQQNHKKYLATGNPASIYCASVSKSLTHDVVFGSPRTVLN